MVTIRVHWADSAVEDALARLIAYRDGESALHPDMQEIQVAIDALRQFVGESEAHTIGNAYPVVDA